MQLKKLQGNAGIVAGAGMLGIVFTLIVSIISLQIINSSLASANFTGLLGTTTGNIPLLLAVGLLASAIGWAFVR